ncbi:MAG: transporter [Acidobacteria bacterium]|jgi:MFS family permease|nr:transporter [Acidobacteriota bacterium]
MSFASLVEKTKTGFSPTFWIANVIELFERFAYYGSKAILAVFVADQVGLGPEKAGWLVGSLFNGLLYFLPILAGTIVDRFGFKKSLLACFSIFCLGYLLIGLGGLPQGKPLVDALGAEVYMILALVVTAAGGSLIKPSIVGTVARTTTPDTKELGYSIYYTLVNLGGAIGPILALQVRENLGISFVLVMSSLTSLLLVLATLVFYSEPKRPADAPPPKTMAGVLADMFLVFGNLRFMSFLVIFSGFWAMFWHVFYALPFYVRDVLGFQQFEIIETIDAWTIIIVTVPVTAIARRLSPLAAMIAGFVLASASWFVMGAFPTLAMTVAAIVVFALGESTQAPRYYAYVADLAPKEQVGTYMGFAFLPIAIGTFIAGVSSGKLVAHYVGATSGGTFHPGPGFAYASHMWYWVGGMGVVSTVLMVVYDRLVVRRPRA